MKYRYIGTGANPDTGWLMSPEIYARCPQCGYYMSLGPTTDDMCPCKNIYKDTGMGRFGAKTGDASIDLYRKSDEEEADGRHGDGL